MIYGGYFEVDSKIIKIKQYELTMQQDNFWNDKENADKVINKLNNLKSLVNNINDIKINLISYIEILELMDNDIDEEIFSTINGGLLEIKNKYSKLELEILLNGEYDNNNAILEIHSGAGGTEACDWANMLFRMYTRYCENNNFKYQILNKLEGEETGIKSVSLLINGINAYGYLKCEKGIHRLVRLSPFDSNNKRHTSFASVFASPEIEDNTEIDIKPNDLKIDVYRSSGAGGQSVNTTDSAVRITHLPTNIIVTCQNERSQLKNKDLALKILRSKLTLLEIEKKEQKISDLKSNQSAINFGSQIRSYVMHPYSLVKDHRTNTETSNVLKVLDGDIEMFINAYLRKDVE